jgi:hypothetical protein
MYFINLATGGVYSYHFANSPSVVANVTPGGGTFTGFGFNNQLFVTDVAAGNLMVLGTGGSMSVFASGFAGYAHAPAIGPNGVAFDGSALYVGDGDTIYRISALTPDRSRINRSMTVTQRKSGRWDVACHLHYGEIDGSHVYDVNLFAGGPGILTFPYGGIVSPTQRRIVIMDPGKTTFTARLTQNGLDVDRSLFLAAAPSTGDSFYCQCGALDRTVGKQLRAVLMYDVSR